MQIKNLNNKAFSLLEVLLASIIFVISVGGIFATLDAIRRPVADKETALSAALFGKQVLETLRYQVNANTFYGPCALPNTDGTCGDLSLYLGAHEVSVNTLQNSKLFWPSNLQTVNTVCGSNPSTLCLQYTVSCGDGSAATNNTPPNCPNPYTARSVTLNILWTPST